MQKELSISLSPEKASNVNLYRKEVAEKLNINEKDITGIEVLKKSIDARSPNVKINIHIKVWWSEQYLETKFEYRCLNLQ